MYVSVFQSTDEPLDQFILAAIDVANKLDRDVGFNRLQGIDLIVGKEDTLESVHKRIDAHVYTIAATDCANCRHPLRQHIPSSYGEISCIQCGCRG